MAIHGADVLLVEKHPTDHYAVVTVNREERANTITLELVLRLEAVWSDLRDDDDIWAIVLTAAGDRYFCVGEDLKDRIEIDATHEGGFEAKTRQVLKGRLPKLDPALLECWKPVIGAVNGSAMAGGFYLAQVCDVRIAAEHARFGIPEVRWNLPAPYAAQLQRVIPPAIATEMTLWGGRDQSARRMYEVGFLNKVVEEGGALADAVTWAQEVCEMGPVAVQTHKQLMYRYLYQDSMWAQSLSYALFDRVVAMEDTIEGPRAFAEKRKPEWKLR